MGEDCPVFDGLYEFCQLSTGGSVGMQYQPLSPHMYSYFIVNVHNVSTLAYLKIRIYESAKAVIVVQNKAHLHSV